MSGGNDAMAAIYEIFIDADGKFRFWLISDSGRLLLRSKAHESRDDCETDIESAKRNAAARQRFERKETTDGKCYFVLKAANDRTLARSAKFRSADFLEDTLEIVHRNAPKSPVNDLTADLH